jgi:ubiquitin C-terminal hydrolase
MKFYSLMMDYCFKCDKYFSIKMEGWETFINKMLVDGKRKQSILSSAVLDYLLIGMLDWGGMCYFNSILQVMLPTHKLWKGMSDVLNNNTLTIALKKLFIKNVL